MNQNVLIDQDQIDKIADATKCPRDVATSLAQTCETVEELIEECETMVSEYKANF